MITPMDVVKGHPIRKSKKQKETFRKDVIAWLETLGYHIREESGGGGCCNVVIGDPTCAKYLVTAHYDTCVRFLLPNFITPCSLILFLLYQFLLCVLMIGLPIAAGATAGMLANSFDVGYWTFLILLWGNILLSWFGPANPSNVNDNTSGVVTLLEIAASIPKLHRDAVCFVLFDMEEAGLVGSAAYRKRHKEEIRHQIVLNLDCVGDGDFLYLFPTAQLKKDKENMSQIRKITGAYGKKRICVQEKGFSVYPSDQRNFPYGVGICALRKGKIGLYLSRIHTPKDIILEKTNVNLLRAALVTIISDTAV